MIRLLSLSARAILVLVVVTVVLVTALFSQLDESRHVLERIIPYLPISKSTPGDPAAHGATTSPASWSPSDIFSDILGKPGQAESRPEETEEAKEHHWIDDLIAAADTEYENFLAKETKGVKEAAAAYRRRRGRQPPPDFDKWVAFAEENGAVMVEDFFDQIYHDLDPLWALPADEIRRAALGWKCFISVRDGNATYHTDMEREWMDLWTDLVSHLAPLLPDMDIAINEMDESRVMVPWEEMQQHRQVAAGRWNKFPAQAELQTTDYPSRYNNTYDHSLYPDFGFGSEGKLWSRVQKACPPDSPGRATEGKEVDIKARAPFPQGAPQGSYHGFVSNWTYSKDPCVHAHLRELHGSFVQPVSMSTTTKFIPMFGGSKLPMNNDILLPAAMYWTDNVFYKGTEKRISWEEKHDAAIWRGAASGGRNEKHTWHRFQRHRFVSMMNGTQIHAAELLAAAEQHPQLVIDVGDANNKTSLNFPLPTQEIYNLSSQLDGRLGPWTDSWSDAKFVNLLCWPNEKRGAKCSYTDPFYETAKHTKTDEQYTFKYLPDVDGNSFSGRYRGFLRSFSVPIKATIYSEWHDSRLVAWKHFVPMDNTFVDFHGIMEYFLGYDPVKDDKEDVDHDLRRAHALECEEDRGTETPNEEADTSTPADGQASTSGEADNTEEANSGSEEEEDQEVEGNLIPDVLEELEQKEKEMEQKLHPPETSPDTSDAAALVPAAHPKDPTHGTARRRQVDGDVFADDAAKEAERLRELASEDAPGPSTSKPTAKPRRKAPHDAAARRIAEEGHEWAEKVLRREDMLIYTYRLLLEYARIAADRREQMGWVGDGVVFGFNDQQDYADEKQGSAGDDIEP